MDDGVVENEWDALGAVIGCTQRFESLDEPHGGFRPMLDPHPLAGRRMQRTGNVVFVVLPRCRHAKRLAAPGPTGADTPIEVDVGLIQIDPLVVLAPSQSAADSSHLAIFPLVWANPRRPSSPPHKAQARQ